MYSSSSRLSETLYTPALPFLKICLILCETMSMAEYEEGKSGYANLPKELQSSITTAALARPFNSSCSFCHIVSHFTADLVALKIIAFTGKSGLSPLESTAPFNEAQQRYREEYLRYQRDRLYGFTTAELIENQAFAPEYQATSETPVSESELRNLPVHELFNKSKWQFRPWRHEALYPLYYDGIDGFWDVCWYPPSSLRVLSSVTYA